MIISNKKFILSTAVFLLFSSISLFAQFNKFKDIQDKYKPGFAIKNKTVSKKEITAGFKEALKISTESIVKKLGALDGFNKDPQFHIPLPKKLRKQKRTLSKITSTRIYNDLELKLNRAAEKASPIAKDIFWKAIREMNFKDIIEIYNGPKDSATRYFEQTMTPELTDRMKPVIENSLAEVGAIQTYESIMKDFIKLGIVPDIKAELTDYVLKKSFEAMFYYIAQEEIAIRTKPAKRTTALLKRVFTDR